MQKFSVKIQIQIIVATFAMPTYIRINSSTDPVFQVLKQYSNFMPSDELNEDTSLIEESVGVRSTKIKDVRMSLLYLYGVIDIKISLSFQD